MVIKNVRMRKIFSTLFLISGCYQGYSQPITWSAPVTVYTGSGSNLHPRISLNRSGNPLILWGKTDTRAYFSRWNGTAFTAPATVSGPLTIFAQWWAGPDMATFGDTVYATMKVTPENVITAYDYLVHSYDGGMTFSAPVRIDNIDTNTSRFPIVTTTSTGNPLIAFMKFNSSTLYSGSHYVVVRSTDFGNTFSTEVQASSVAGEVCNCCPATIVSSGSNAIMLYRNNLTNIRDIWAGISTDGGMTFPNNIDADINNWLVTSCPASGPDGFVIGDSIYTVFMSKPTGTSMVYLSHSSISALSSYTNPITGMFSGLLSQNYPRIANAGYAAAAVWTQNTSSGNTIAYAFTNNIAYGFSGYNTVTGATGSGIMNADVAMSPGFVHVVWEDDNTGNVMYMKGAYTISTTSVEPLAKKELIEVYPNPANENFSVRLNGIGNISSCFLSDIAGRQIQLQPTYKNGIAIFSLHGIAKGGYYFVLTDDAGKNYYSKIVVQ